MIHDLVLVAVVLLALVSLYWTVRPPRPLSGVGENPPPTTPRPPAPPAPPWARSSDAVSHDDKRRMVLTGPHPTPLRMMDIGEFVKLGLLQEVNRQFLHPRGLALVVESDDETGESRILGVKDSRDDPEGMVFEWDDPADAHAKARAANALWHQRARARERILDGAIVQLLPPESS